MFERLKEKYRKEGRRETEKWIISLLEEMRKDQAYAANALEYQTATYSARNALVITPAEYAHAATVLQLAKIKILGTITAMEITDV